MASTSTAASSQQGRIQINAQNEKEKMFSDFIRMFSEVYGQRSPLQPKNIVTKQEYDRIANAMKEAGYTDFSKQTAMHLWGYLKPKYKVIRVWRACLFLLTSTSAILTRRTTEKQYHSSTQR